MTKHGGYGTPEYRSWQGMIRRCCNPNSTDFRCYGGRGITITAKWRHSFAAFLADLGPRPSAAHSLDRINTNGNYEPGNVRWATIKEQNRNKRTNRRVIFRGAALPVSELAERVGLPSQTLANRLNAGLTVEQAISKPIAVEANLKRAESMRRAWARRKVVA